MFNFFKKKEPVNKLTANESKFIATIINKLSSKYPLFKTELNLETFVGVAKNPGGSKGSYTYLLNNDSWEKICNASLANYDVKSIKFKTHTNNKVIVDLFISEGLIIGYRTNESVSDINLDTISINDIWEKHFLNDDYTEIESVVNTIPTVQQKRLNMLKNTFKISINQGEYYPIYDIGDGNYFAIDKSGSVFKITHDPFEAKKLYNTILELLEKNFE